MKRSSLVLASFVVALCLFIATSCSQKSTNDNSNPSAAPTPPTSNTANSATQKPKPKRPAPDFTVTAKDIFKEVDEEKDREKVEGKYAGKQIAVSGRVKGVTISSTPMRVYLAAEGRRSMSGNFDEEEKDSLISLKEDQNVTMQCLGGDYWVGSPSLKHCTIVNVE